MNNELLSEPNLPIYLIDVFGDAAVGANRTKTKSIDANLNVDQYDQLYGVEILWFKDQIGEVTANNLMQRLILEGILFTYDDEVDILHFSLTSNLPYVKKRQWNAEIAIDENSAIAFYLKAKE